MFCAFELASETKLPSRLPFQKLARYEETFALVVAEFAWPTRDRIAIWQAVLN